MAARKKTATGKKAQYVRAKQRKGADSSATMRRTVTIIFLVLILVGLMVGIIKGFGWINNKLYSKNPRFEIQHLVISSDGRLSEDYIREISGLREGLNLFEYSFTDLEQKLLNVSLIESVGLERKLPHTLIVRVKERIPVAQVVGRRQTRIPWMIDRYGYVLPPRRKAGTLPLITGLDADFAPGEQLTHKDIKTALDIIGICESSSYLNNYIRIESLDLQYSDYINMRLEEGIRVRMARFSLKPKLTKLASVIKVSKSRGQRIKDVDLTLDSAKVPTTTY